MAKSKNEATEVAKTEATEVAMTDTNEALNDAVVVKLDNEIQTSGLGNLDDMKKSYNLVCKYLKMEQGEVRRFFFVGLTEVTIEGKVKPAVFLIDKDGHSFVSATYALVSSLGGLPKADNQPIPVELSFLGMESTKNDKGEKIQVARYDIVKLQSK